MYNTLSPICSSIYFPVQTATKIAVYYSLRRTGTFASTRDFIYDDPEIANIHCGFYSTE